MDKTKNIKKTVSKCIICGSDIESSVCPKCGWIDINIPEHCPNELRDMNRRRVEAMRKAYERSKDTEILLKEAQRDIDEGKTLLSQVMEKIKELSFNLNRRINIPHIDICVGPGRKSQPAFVGTSEILKFYYKELEDIANTDKKQGETIKLLKSDLEVAKREYTQLSAELEKAKQTKQALGIVLITDTENDFQAVAPINPGLNTFGSDASSNNHHMIRLSPFSTQLNPKHFSVESTGKHLLLKDLTGGSMSLPASGMYAEGKTIKLNNSIEVKFLKIL